jgi:hypothetical protein
MRIERRGTVETGLRKVENSTIQHHFFVISIAICRKYTGYSDVISEHHLVDIDASVYKQKIIVTILLNERKFCSKYINNLLQLDM